MSALNKEIVDHNLNIVFESECVDQCRESVNIHDIRFTNILRQLSHVTAQQDF